MPASTIDLNCQSRILVGRKTRQLRRAGILPVNLYGKGLDSVSLQVNKKDFAKVFNIAGETKVINLTIDADKQTHPVLVTNIQVHPLSDAPVHVDFRQVNLREKITANIPVELTGESPATEQGNVVIQMLSEIEVEALPNDLPDNFTVDISTLENVDDAIYIKDLNFDHSKVSIELDLDTMVVKVEAPAAEEEEAPTELTPADVEITGEKPEGEEGESEESATKKEE